MESQLIYLDNNATTRPAPEVIAAVLQSLATNWANPSSIHGMGQEVARGVEAARDQVAALLGVRIEQIVFTAGATEANEAVLRFHAAQGAILVTSAAEHAAVAGMYLRHMPERVRSVKLNENGQWSLDCLQEILSNTKGKKLIALAWANGETGVLQDLLEIATLAERHGAACLIDATQAVGRVTVKAPDTVYLTLSGHKLHGPKGIGVLVQPKARPPVEVAIGGGQEGGRRGGTLNVPGIVGLGIACEHRYRSLTVAIARMALLRDLFEEQIAAEIPDLRINGFHAPRVPNTSNLTFPGVDGMALVARLEARSIVCSQVSACSSGLPEPSKTLLAMGRSREEAFASIRFAVSVETTEAEIESAARAVIEEVQFLQVIMGGLV